MKKTFTVLAVLLLLAALGGGGFYYFKDQFPGYFPPAPPAPAPAPAPTAAPVELPPPVLSGETEAPAAPAAPGAALATLVSLERTVKAKRASDISWEDAQQKMPLYENDAVRTFEKSAATIAFGPDDLLDVDQNALVIIKPRPKGGDDSEISLALLSSDFLDGLASKPAPEQAKAIQAAAARRSLTIKSLPEGRKSGEPARIALRTLPDKSTSVAAVAGSLKITGPKGEAVVLKEKMVTKVTENGLLQPRQLPGSPEPLFPADGATYGFQRKVPKVELRWKPADRGRSYRLVVATDAKFQRIFADEKVDGTTLTVQIRQPGTYYWRVRAQDGDGFAGPYSAVRSVKADYDDTPPALAILSPPEMFVAPLPSVELKGKTERDAKVKVNGQKAAVGADGTFTFPLTLKEGVNLVTIEAIDTAGNSEYGKRLITYKGAKRATASMTGNR